MQVEGCGGPGGESHEGTCGVGLVSWWLLPFPPGLLSRLPALLPELFPSSGSGSPWGGGEVGNGGGTSHGPPFFAGRRDNGCGRRAHTGHAPRLAGVRLVCWRCWGLGLAVPGPGDGLAPVSCSLGR